MKKFLLIMLAALLTMPLVANAQLNYDLQGKILLQVEANGEAYYVFPDDRKGYYLGRPADAFQIMRTLGLGIAHDELQGYLDSTFPSRLSGYIMLDVEANGEAYYVFPDDRKGYYLGRPADAFQIMREKGLGISNDNLYQIPVINGQKSTNQLDSNEQKQQNNQLSEEYLEQKAHKIVNNHRQSVGAKPLIWQNIIAVQSRNHSQKMAGGEIQPSHQGFEQRVEIIGETINPYFGAAENLAWNNQNNPAEAALDWWLDSTKHRNSIENKDYDLTGIGVKKSSDGIYYFTQIFFDID